MDLSLCIYTRIVYLAQNQTTEPDHTIRTEPPSPAALEPSLFKTPTRLEYPSPTRAVALLDSGVAGSRLSRDPHSALLPPP
jgi:hypothetical protein